ncbi:MAG: NUDIX hydrolase [Candidatus Thermoplasmatota archaeon]|nr:NUDIX hydrolase [Candidatus Thermoplasmatota archaeon]MBU1941939.1 NUDIX hydrolase [Candidatus Thermoplasmatota archaeon]
MAHKSPKVTVDAVLLKDSSVLLVKRRYPPFEGYWALPGGFVEYGETTETAVLREMVEETGLQVRVERLIGVYSNPTRDPRGHTISVVYKVIYKSGELIAGDDAAAVKYFNAMQLPPLAFDHEKILSDIQKVGV